MNQTRCDVRSLFLTKDILFLNSIDDKLTQHIASRVGAAVQYVVAYNIIYMTTMSFVYCSAQNDNTLINENKYKYFFLVYKKCIWKTIQTSLKKKQHEKRPM